MARTDNQTDAEDLAQDILCEIIKSAPNIREENAFYGFMWSVAGNVYKQWYRKKLLKRECELTDDFEREKASKLLTLQNEIADKLKKFISENEKQSEASDFTAMICRFLL